MVVKLNKVLEEVLAMSILMSAEDQRKSAFEWFEAEYSDLLKALHDQLMEAATRGEVSVSIDLPAPFTKHFKSTYYLKQPLFNTFHAYMLEHGFGVYTPPSSSMVTISSDRAIVPDDTPTDFFFRTR